jgi:hypothetical protein
MSLNIDMYQSAGTSAYKHMIRTNPTMFGDNLDLNLRDLLALLVFNVIVSNTCSSPMCVMSIFNVQQVTTLLDMVLPAEEDIHFFQ